MFGKGIQKIGEKKAGRRSLKFKKISPDGTQIGRSYIQEKYFGLIAAYNDLQKTLFRGESNHVVINTVLSILRKRFPFSPIRRVFVDLFDFLNCDFLTLEKNGIKAAEVKVKSHNSRVLTCNPCFSGSNWNLNAKSKYSFNSCSVE
jgi:hypothetical protein